jgi:hypothetical protein
MGLQYYKELLESDQANILTRSTSLRPVFQGGNGKRRSGQASWIKAEKEGLFSGLEGHFQGQNCGFRE